VVRGRKYHYHDDLRHAPDWERAAAGERRRRDATGINFESWAAPMVRADGRWAVDAFAITGVMP